MSGGGGGEGGLDFDLNLAPIIDCFTVLITFMLVSASFLSISVLEASVTPLEAPASEPISAPPPLGVSLTAELKQSGEIELKITGEETRSQFIAPPPGGGGRNLAGLVGELQNVKARWPQTASLTLTAEPRVEYDEIIRALEAVRGTMPKVMLGGF